MKRSSIAAFAALVVMVAFAAWPRARDRYEIVADWRHDAKPHHAKPKPKPPEDKRTDHKSAGVGQTVLNTTGPTPCPKRPGPPKRWEGSGMWNACNGNLEMPFLGGLLVFNSERNSAIHPFHSTGGAPAGGYAGWGFKIGTWDQQLTLDDSNNPPSSVTIANGQDGQDVYVLKQGSSGPYLYEDKEDKHWTLTTLDRQTWFEKTFEGTVYEFDTRPHGILLTSITDKAGNKTAINLDPSADTITSVVDYLKRTWQFAYTNGNLTTITSPAPESLVFTLQYDTQGYDNLTFVQLPSTSGGMRGYRIGYVDWLGNHSPFPMSIQSPSGLMTFDFYNDGALVNVFYLQKSPKLATFHAEYNSNKGSNLVTFESPTANTPKTRIVYNATFDQGSGDPTQDFWITSTTTAKGISSSVVRNSRHEVTQATDGLKQVWNLKYWPNGEDLWTVTDPAGKVAVLTWKDAKATDGASSGEIESVEDLATNYIESFVWNQATSGVWYHTIDEIDDQAPNSPMLSVQLKKTDPGGNHAVRQYVNNQFIGEVLLSPKADAVLERDDLGFSEKVVIDPNNFDQPSSMTFLAQGAQVGQAALSLSANGVLRSMTNVLGEKLDVMMRDGLLRPLETVLTLQSGSLDTTLAYGGDQGDTDGQAISESFSANGVQEGSLRQVAAAAGVDDCSNATLVNGQTIPLRKSKLVVAGARVACGAAPPPPPPPPPPDGGAVDAGTDAGPMDSGWVVDAPDDVSLPEAGCPPPNGISCQLFALEEDGWCPYVCAYEPADLCQDPMNCSGSDLQEWNCPGSPIDPCPGF
jgi:hypothetical protein